MGRFRFHLRRVIKNFLLLGAFALFIVMVTQTTFHSNNNSSIKHDDYIVLVQFEESAAESREAKSLVTKQNRAEVTASISKAEEVTEVRKTILATHFGGHDATDNNPGRLWYDPNYDWDDRIMAQLRYTLPEEYRLRANMKLIHVSPNMARRKKLGQQFFLDDQCAIDKCLLTTSEADMSRADVVISNYGPLRGNRSMNPQQIRVYYQLESPKHSHATSGMHAFNWTATYRHDSTIVAPYEKFVLYDNRVLGKPQNRNYALNKTKKVAWFVSNCGASNGRLQYAHELQRHLEVDIYGKCGEKQCPRHTKGEVCFKMLAKEYKFYLSFENSNCKDYITEKLYWNAFQNDVIPIVMGGSPEDYRRACPHHSFIHVDDFPTVKELAEYLLYLDEHDDEYNKYFEWKGTGTFTNTKFLCRVCAMAHAADAMNHKESVRDLREWWGGSGVCISGKWPKDKHN